MTPVHGCASRLTGALIWNKPSGVIEKTFDRAAVPMALTPMLAITTGPCEISDLGRPVRVVQAEE
jgi:hypothetical protein